MRIDKKWEIWYNVWDNICWGIKEGYDDINKIIEKSKR
jgi:hypothetical protein